jgi:uncharacterized protein (DUF362 family)
VNRPPIDRRVVLRRLGQGGAVLGATGILAALGLRSGGRFRPPAAARTVPDHRVGEDPLFPPLAVARGANPAVVTRAALEALGGMGRFVGEGETVLVKPNMAWDRTPEQGANTHPAVVAEVVRQCRAAGAGRVIVTDNPVHDAPRVAERSGIGPAVADAGGELALPRSSGFQPALLDGAVLTSWEVLATLLEAHRLINVPVAKHHSLSEFTGGLKNHIGLLGGRRGRLHQEIHTAVVDLAAAFLPTLTVIDATRVMVRNGPTGGRLEDVKRVDAVAAATDPVAADAWGARQIGLDPREVDQLVQAEERGLGHLAAGAGSVAEVDAGV